MIHLIEYTLPPLSILIVLLIGKYLLLIFCFGSSTPGRIFYPVLVIGAYIGAIFSAIVIPIFRLDPMIAYKFIMIFNGSDVCKFSENSNYSSCIDCRNDWSDKLLCSNNGCNNHCIYHSDNPWK